MWLSIWSLALLFWAEYMFLMMSFAMRRVIADSWALGNSTGVIHVLVAFTFWSVFLFIIGGLCHGLIFTDFTEKPRPFRWRSVARVVLLMSSMAILCLAYPVDRELVATYLAAGDYLRVSVRGLFWVSVLGQMVGTSHSLIAPDDAAETSPDLKTAMDDSSDAAAFVAMECDA